jgi:hypothetical protein
VAATPVYNSKNKELSHFFGLVPNFSSILFSICPFIIFRPSYSSSCTSIYFPFLKEQVDFATGIFHICITVPSAATLIFFYGYIRSGNCGDFLGPKTNKQTNKTSKHRLQRESDEFS